MPRSKKPRGRPGQGYPPRTEATVDELVDAFFRAPRGAVVDAPEVYRCVDCRRAAYYPEILYRDGLCEECHNAPAK